MEFTVPFEFKKPKKSINPAFFRQPVPQNEIERLKKALSVYLSLGKPDESEEFHKNLIKKFLEETFYSPDYAVNTNGREDLVIFGGNTANSKPAVIIEAKSPSNTAEMFSETNFNCKALQECVYYFMQENLKFQNNEIKHIIITNYYDFYIFDAKDFARFFLVKTNPIIDQFLKFEAKQLSDTKTAYFYENCAKPAIEKWIENENIVVTKVTPAEFAIKSSPKLGEVSRSDGGVCLSFDTRPSQQADSPSNLEGHLKNLEAEINSLVYELYGLGDEEISKIESK